MTTDLEYDNFLLFPIGYLFPVSLSKFALKK